MSKLSGIIIDKNKEKGIMHAVKAPLPANVRVPLGRCSAKVGVGDAVVIGQMIGEDEKGLFPPVHASVSGTVTCIDNYITIENDRLQKRIEKREVCVSSREQLVKAAYDCGLVGLGGAAFPTHVKLDTKETIDTLIINGAECEPYIVSDRCMMCDYPKLIAFAARIVMEFLGIGSCILAIEHETAEAAKAISELGINVKVLGDRYPRGAEKVLVYETTGRVIKEGKLPFSCGVLVMNVSTLAKLGEYMETGMPLVSKYVTVGGVNTETRCLDLPIGTPVNELLSYMPSKPKLLVDGGVMMGREITKDDVIRKSTGAVLTLEEKSGKDELSCIRCGRCFRACPVRLSPAAFDRAYHARNVSLLKRLGISICLECGCCEYVCPAKRRLTEYNRRSKRLVKEAEK